LGGGLPAVRKTGRPRAIWQRPAFAVSRSKATG
jgi:hypothetical protein